MPPKSKPTPAVEKPNDATPAEPEQSIDLAAAFTNGLPVELEEAAKYGITVDQLREIRAQAAAEISAAVITRQDDGLDPQADYCGVCLPNGWPAGGDHLDCPHGTWKR
jgi:hypothetical protein